MQIDPTTRSSKGKSVGKFPTLFTTVLESNALLREEIDQMEESKCTAFIKGCSMQGLCSGTGEGQIQGEGSGKDSQPESIHLLSSLAAASEEKAITHDNGLGKENASDASSQTEETDTDETWESDEEDNQVRYCDSSLSPVQQPCDRVKSGDLCAPFPPPLSITSVSSTEVSSALSENSEGDPFASPGGSMIEAMWDNFSVDEYAPPLKQMEQKVRKCSSVPVQQEWSNRVTIPQPFTMMIRESGKPKKKSKALIIAEQERLERELQEELECQKKFRALPVPAATYVPLYELRREHHKQPQECAKVVHSIKPFSFMKREEEKRQRKLETLNKRTNKKANKTHFKAKPVPQNILSPQVSEQLKEKEEYRRILIRVRSQEMLAQAELPRNMQMKGREYTVGKLRKERLENRQSSAFVTKEHTFHPKIKPTIPDHDYLYSQFQQQLAAQRELKPPTTPKPFLLRTSSAPPHRVHIEEQAEHSKSHSLKSLGRSSTFANVPYSKSGPCRPMYNIQMTQAAKLRQSVNEKKLAEDMEKEAETEEVRRSKREQQRELQNRVVQCVQSYDHSAWLQEKQKEKIQELRSVLLYRMALYMSEYCGTCVVV